MLTNKMNNEPLNSKGVTLVELLIVIVVMGIIAAFSVISVGAIITNTRESMQKLNMQTIKTYIDEQMVLGDFNDETIYTYKRSGSADETYLSIFLETTWEIENGSGDADNTNILNFTNSVSSKLGVVNWNDAPGLGNDIYCNQSLYITTDSDAAYDVGNPITIDACYAGSIVIWYDGNSADNIIIYFVDSESLQTEKYFIYSK